MTVANQDDNRLNIANALCVTGVDPESAGKGVDRVLSDDVRDDFATLGSEFNRARAAHQSLNPLWFMNSQMRSIQV